MPKRASPPINKRSLRIQITKPNYSDEKRKSPRNLALNNKAKVVENILQKPATKKKNATNSSTSVSEEIVESATETQVRSGKSDYLKQILDDINSKINSSSAKP